MRTAFILFLVLGGVFVVLLLLLPLMGSHTEKLYTRIYVQFYEERRLAAIKGDMQQAAENLKSVVEYEPLKVPAEGDLGRALKVVRQGAIREIITRMRTLSGEDLGDDPEPWIKKYYRTDNFRPNKPAAGNAGWAPQLAIGHHWPGVPEPDR
jgi:hypothetical protein